MSAETTNQIRASLLRLYARVADVGADGIDVSDRGHEGVILHCRYGREFSWCGSADEALRRLSRLPDADDKNGPELVRSEFASG